MRSGREDNIIKCSKENQEMSKSSEDRLKNLPSEDREFLQASLVAGEEVYDLLEEVDDMVDPWRLTPPQQSKGKRNGNHLLI